MGNFYKTKRWQSKREKVLKRDEYLCRECKRYGKSVQATTVHHIIPLEWCLAYNKELALASMNLISLCDQCHERMHDRTTGKLTELGLAWVRRMGDLGLKWLEKYAR